MNSQAPAADVNRALYHELVELAQPHIERSNGLLDTLDYDPDQYTAQQYDRHVVAGKVMPIEVLDLIGTTVLEGYAGKTATRGFTEISEDLMTTGRRQVVRGTLRGRKSLYV